MTTQEAAVLDSWLAKRGFPLSYPTPKLYDNTFWSAMTYDLTVELQEKIGWKYTGVDAARLLHERNYYADYEKPQPVTDPQSTAGKAQTAAEQQDTRTQQQQAAALSKWLPLVLAGGVLVIGLTARS